MIMEKESVINDIEIYNTRMDASIEDKLWFLNQSKEPDVYVDFGCANGNLLKEMYQKSPGKVYIGYDNNPDMLCLARKHCLGTSIFFEHVFEDVKKYLDPGKKVCLIMSSVLHEVYSYAKSYTEIQDLWNTIIKDLNPDYIAIRDMTWWEYDRCSHPSSRILTAIKEQCEVVRSKADQGQIKDFERIYGPIDCSKRLTHFLLKYRYVENWNREVQENYFSYDLETVISELKDNYEVVYMKKYLLPYFHKQFKGDFDIDFMGFTHYNMLLRNDKRYS